MKHLYALTALLLLTLLLCSCGAEPADTEADSAADTVKIEEPATWETVEDAEEFLEEAYETPTELATFADPYGMYEYTYYYEGEAIVGMAMEVRFASLEAAEGFMNGFNTEDPNVSDCRIEGSNVVVVYTTDYARSLYEGQTRTELEAGLLDNGYVKK